MWAYPQSPYGFPPPYVNSPSWEEWEKYKKYVEADLKQREEETKKKTKPKRESPRISVATAFLMVTTFGPFATLAYLALIKLVALNMVDVLNNVVK